MANATTNIYGRHKNFQEEPMGFTANQLSAGVASGGAATVVFTCPTDKGVAVDYVDFGYRVAPTSGSIQISDGTLTWGPFTVILGGLQTRTFRPPLLFSKNANVTVTLADGSQTKDLFAQAHVDGVSLY